MLRVTLPRAGFGDKLIDMTGSMTLTEILDIQLEIHWVLLHDKDRFAYSPALINAEFLNPTIFLVPRKYGTQANTLELETSGIFAPYIVKKTVESLLKESNDADRCTDLLSITGKWLQNLRKIQLNPIVSYLVPAEIEGSIGIHLRRSDKLRNDGALSWNDMDVQHYDEMMQAMMTKVVELIKDHDQHAVGELSFYICSEDQPFKEGFKTWLLEMAANMGKQEHVKVRTINKDDIPTDILSDYCNIYDVVEWCALTRCKMILQGINYSTFSMCASMWANIPLHNFTDPTMCSDKWLTHLWKPCLKLVHCDKANNHVVNYKKLSQYDRIVPRLNKSFLNYSLCKIFCLTKNEYDLLEDYLMYYGSIFGHENIILIDNGSTHPSMPSIYQKYEQKGVNIHVDRRQMRKQADIMTDCMRLYQNQCDFMMPLDTDEFIYCTKEQMPTMKTIAQALESMPRVFTVMFYKHVLNSVVDPTDPSYKHFCHEQPSRTMTKFKAAEIQKAIVRSSAFDFLVMGNHEAHTYYGYRMISKDLGLLHFHNTGPSRKYERALQTITELGFIKPDLANLSQLLAECKAFVPCVGGHAYSQFIDFLLRMLAISSWMRKYNRLPSMDEIAKVDKLKDYPSEVIIGKINELCDNAVLSLAETTASGLYDVLFGNWPTERWEVEIDQVARYMRTLSPYPD
jgi:hypothetical protein